MERRKPYPFVEKITNIFTRKARKEALESVKNLKLVEYLAVTNNGGHIRVSDIRGNFKGQEVIINCLKEHVIDEPHFIRIDKNGREVIKAQESHHKLTKAWVNDELISEPDADVLFDKVYNTLSDRNKVEKVSTIPYPKETIWEKFRELSSPKPGV